MTPLALLMHREIQAVSGKTMLEEAARVMRDKKVGSLLIHEGDRFVGIVSESDFVRKAAACGLRFDQTTVETIMSTPILSIDIDQPPLAANEMMASKGVRHLAISDRCEIVGILSMRDLLLCFKNRL